MQPFADERVLDLTQSVAGPICTQMLGALGAEVVKLEPPGGDPFRSTLDGAFFASYNLGGKQSISIDMKTDDGKEIAQDLAAKADVVVENYRPGILEKFGVDYETVAEANPDVIYCSISGFGQQGPYRDIAAFDPVVQAMSGLMSRTGYSDQPPVRIGASVIDCGTGFNAAFLVASALFERNRTGEGRYIDTSLFDVALSWMGYWVAHYDAAGEVPDRSGTQFEGIAPYDIYYAAGGEPFFLGVVNDKLYERFCRTIDREDLVEDARFRSNPVRWEHREVLREELATTFEEYGRDKLVELLADAGVPVGPLNDVARLANEDPHVQAREMLTETYNVHRDTEVKTGNLPFRTEDGEAIEFGGKPPAKGEHTRQVLRGLGYSDDEVEALLTGGVVFE